MALTSQPAWADDAAPDFEREIRPILAQHCYRCHGPQQRKGGLRLTNRTDALTPADSGDVIVTPGQSGKSVLIERVSADDDAVRMPPEGERLTEQQVSLLRRWVDAGARWPDDAAVKHWAYVKPQQVALPEIKDKTWPRNAIDYFILARLEDEGLRPSAEASREQLIRRLSLDLIGLPPTPAEVEAFLADENPAAYEALVDRLLARPQYGERWARPWLDLARYADSNGFQRDGFRDLWPYRDWVVQALNKDIPFDQFTVEQLAGDLLPGATVDQHIATGFHRCTTVNVEAGTDQEENRVNQVIDRVNTTGTVWLGTTIECAQCHNHKYDPITQREYYQLFAFFNNTEIETAFRTAKATAAIDFTGPMLDLPDPETQSKRQRLQEELARVEKQIADHQTALQSGSTEQKASLPDAGQPAQWHVLKIASFKSSGGANGTILDDNSVLLGGEVPAKDTYTLVVSTKQQNITGFHVEALTDPSLPGEGPGRGDDERPNFILNEFTVAVAPVGLDSNPQSLKLHSPQADFSQRGWDVAGAIDGDPKTGWAINPQFHKPHAATFLLEVPLVNDPGCTLTFRLVQNYGGGRTIGRVRLSALTGDRDVAEAPPEIAKILKTPGEKRTFRQIKQLEAFQLSQHPTLKPLQAQRQKIVQQLEQIEPPRTLVMKELATPRTTAVMRRGNFLDPGEAVQPGVPAVLHAMPQGPANRLGLARWLVHAQNPLVARVTVNRQWAELFGQGLVPTLEDFGTRCEPPTHPELLDWLAVEFLRRGWSLKQLHRLLVTSATYRQSAKVTAELLARDDQNKLYARGPRFRLDAETIRDNALAIAGLLSLKQGGPPVKPYQPEGLWNVTGLVDNTYKISAGEDRYRRGLYVVWRRSAPYPSFMNFDAQIRAACTVKRSRSNTPLQALTLLNDPVYVEASKALARRILNEMPSADAPQRLEHGFRLAVARKPHTAEVATLVRLYERSLARYGNDVAAARALVGDFELPAATEPVEFAAWYEAATVLLNLDETITKQ